MARDGGAGSDPAEEIALLRRELATCRRELADARAEQEAVVQREARMRRSRGRANREANVLARALDDLLSRHTRELAGSSGWRARRERRISREEWGQVVVLRESELFQPDWYLRNNLDAVRRRLDPALHFLREGAARNRDPGPDFDVEEYLDEHPAVRASGENPLLHYLGQLEAQPRRD